MRIVGGTFRGMRLIAPAGPDIRPTSDRAREALFNVLVHGFGIRFSEVAIVDLFAGTGALGLEALSRGALRATFVDTAKASLASIRGHVERMRAEDRATILHTDACRLSRPTMPHELAFLDPPYGMNLAVSALNALAKQGWLAPDALCAVETGVKEDLVPPEGFDLEDDRTYGIARIRFLRYSGVA